MTKIIAFRSLSPHAARFRHLGRMPTFRAFAPLPFRSRVRPLTQAQRRAFLSALGTADGFEAACAGAGIPPGAAVAERVRNPRFAREWDQHLDACVSQLETILVEKAITALATGFPASDARDKWLVGVVQWLLDSRRTQAPRGRAAMAGGQPAARNADPARDSAGDSGRDSGRDDVRKVAALIEDARTRLLQSEAQMAKDGLADRMDGDAH